MAASVALTIPASRVHTISLCTRTSTTKSSPTSEPGRSDTWIYDAKLWPGTKVDLPALPAAGPTALLYVYQGQISVNETTALAKKEALVVKDEAIAIQ